VLDFFRRGVNSTSVWGNVATFPFCAASREIDHFQSKFRKPKLKCKEWWLFTVHYLLVHSVKVTLTLWRPLVPYGSSYKAQPWASQCPDVKNYKWQLNLVWHRMLYSYTHMATMGVKGLRWLKSLGLMTWNSLSSSVPHTSLSAASSLWSTQDWTDHPSIFCDFIATSPVW